MVEGALHVYVYQAVLVIHSTRHSVRNKRECRCVGRYGLIMEIFRTSEDVTDNKGKPLGVSVTPFPLGKKILLIYNGPEKDPCCSSGTNTSTSRGRY